MAKLLEGFAAGNKPPSASSLVSSISLFVVGALFALATVGLRDAHAEAQPLTAFRGGGLTITTLSPRLDKDNAFIDCSVTAKGCYPLNRKACTDEGYPIRFTLGQPLSQAAPNYIGGTQSLYAFLSNTPSCIYSTNTAQVAANGNLIGTSTGLPLSSVFFNTGFTAFQFPNDLATLEPNVMSNEAARTFTTRDLLHLVGACPESGGTPVDLTPVYICVGIDSTGNKGGVNNATTATSASSSTTATSTGTSNTSSGDLFGYMALQVDTLAPKTPTSMVITPKNGRVDVRLQYDTSLLDVYTLRVHYTDDADDLAQGDALDANGTARGCAAWTKGKTLSMDVKGVADGNKSFGVNKLDNGRAYSFCAVTSDFLLNDSTPTAVQTATPRLECDLFSCYGGDLRVGFCASQDLPLLWSLSAMGAAFALVRRRRRRGPIAWIWVAAVSLGVGISHQARAEPPTWLKSEPPVSTEHGKPQGYLGDPPESQTDRRRPPIAFGGGTSEQLDFSPKRPLTPSWMLEVQAGPYRPAIGGPQLKELYHLVYDNGRRGLFAHRPLRTRVAGAWFPFRGLVTGPYASLGIWHVSGPSRICGTEEVPTGCTPATVMQSRKGNDTADLYLMPLAIGWQHTQDLARLLRVPLGIGARLGLVGNIWWGNSGGRYSRYNGRRAQGMTVNPELSAHLALDVSALTVRGKESRLHGLIVAEYTYIPPGALFGSDRAHRLDFGAPWFVTLGIRGHFLH